MMVVVVVKEEFVTTWCNNADATGGPLRPNDVGRVTEVDANDPVMPVEVEHQGSRYWFVLQHPCASRGEKL